MSCYELLALVHEKHAYTRTHSYESEAVRKMSQAHCLHDFDQFLDLGLCRLVKDAIFVYFFVKKV